MGNLGTTSPRPRVENGAMLKAFAILAGAAAAACIGLIGVVLVGLVRTTTVHVFALPAAASLFSVAAFALALEIRDGDPSGRSR